MPGVDDRPPYLPIPYDAEVADRAAAVPVTLVGHTGLPGTYVAVGYVPFPPGAITAADVGRLTAWDARGREVACYVEDVGGRHAGTAAPVSLTHVYAELEGTWQDGNVHPTFTFHVARERGAARRAKQGFAPVPNAPAVAPSRTNPAQLAVTNAGFYHHHAEDRVRRWAPGELPWLRVLKAPATMAQDPVRFRRIIGAVCVDQNGRLALVVHSVGSFGGSSPPPPAGSSGLSRPKKEYREWQPIACVWIWVKPGRGIFTIGTTRLTDDMVASVGVRSVAPERFPAATLTPTDPATLTGARLVPWDLPSQDATRVAGGAHATLLEKLRQASDFTWRWVAGDTYSFTQSGLTTYAPNVCEWTLFAQTGALRHLRRAIACYAPWRTAASRQTMGAGSGAPGAWYGYKNEAFLDGMIVPWHYILTGDPEAREHAPDMGRVGEWKQYYGVHNGTLRDGMHVIQNLVMLKRLSLGDRVPGARVTPRPDATTPRNSNAWKQANPSVPVGLDARWARMRSYLASWTLPGDPPNAALRRLWQRDYGGVGTFMFGWIASWAAVAQDVFGADEALDAHIRATFQFLYEARRDDGSPLMYDAAHRDFAYSEREALRKGRTEYPSTALLNGTLFLGLARLRRRYPDEAALWTRRGDALFAALADTNPYAGIAYYGKGISEAGLVTANWLIARRA